MTEKKISIILPVYNGANSIQACIESIFDTTTYPSWELIAIDDGSTDNSLDILQRIKGIRLIRTMRYGTAHALNTGFQAAAGNDIVRIHADVTIETPGWLETFVQAAENTPQAGVIGAKLLRLDDTIQAVGRNILTGIGMREWYASQNAYQLDTQNNGKIQEVDTVPGALAFYRREAIDAVGGIDESYWPSWIEDDDFCIAARFHGFKVFALPAVKAVHYSLSVNSMTKSFFYDSDLQIARAQSIKNDTLQRHFDHWEKKWGWHPLHPDLNEVRRLYGNTEICWRIGERMRFQPKEFPPVVDACMITWNNLAIMRRSLESLALTDYPHEKMNVYIINNASSDGSKEYLDELVRDYPFRLIPIHLDVNVGAPAALNWAFSQGSGEIVAKLDDDIIVPPNWLDMVNDFRERPFAGVVGPKVLNDNTIKDIQCAVNIFYPAYFAHKGELDEGQADYLALGAHVRGCCCLYRRDALQKCGALDIRFSPSQTDDVEHHFRIFIQGYEIVFDGRINIIHTLGEGAGAIRNRKAWSNIIANEYKLRGVWSDDIHQLLEQNIDYTKEGRFLPFDQSDQAWQKAMPASHEFPRKVPFREDFAEIKANHLQQENTYAREFRTAFTGLVYDQVDLGLSMLEQGTELALEAMHQAIHLLPQDPSVMTGLAAADLCFGKPERAKKLFLRAARFSQVTQERHEWLIKWAERCEVSLQRNALDALITEVKKQILNGADRRPSPQAFFNDPGKLRRSQKAATVREKDILRVLMINRYGNTQRQHEDDSLRMINAIIPLAKDFGVVIDFEDSPSPHAEDYDLVHLWGLTDPEQTIQQIKAVRRSNPTIPVVHSPRAMNDWEIEWATNVIPHLFIGAKNQISLDNSLTQIVRGELLANGSGRDGHHEPQFPGYDLYQKAIANLADLWIVSSQAEREYLENHLGFKKPSVQVFDSITDSDLIRRATPDAFINEYGVKDFILMVHPFTPMGNQLMALRATWGVDQPIVFVGATAGVNYRHLCRRFALQNAIFIDYLDPAMLASAYKAASLHILPKWGGSPGLANLEAGLAGCQLLVSNVLSEAEYFHENVYYCDPADVNSIRKGILDAFQNHEQDQTKRASLQETILEEYSWEKNLPRLLGAYQKALTLRNSYHPWSATLAMRSQKYQEMRNPKKPSVEDVDIVIPIYGQAKKLIRCLQTVLTTEPFAKIILVDDCSPDKDVADVFKVMRDNPRIKITKTKKNLGFIGACKHGATQGNSPFILFLNSDTEAIENGWMEKMIPTDSEVAIVGAQLLYSPEIPSSFAGCIQHAGIGIDNKGMPFHPFVGLTPFLKEANTRRELNAVTGACFLVRRKVWEELGGWDEGFGTGILEDVDFCWRARQKGYKVIYEPAVKFYHWEHASQKQGKSLHDNNWEKNYTYLSDRWGKRPTDLDLFYDTPLAEVIAKEKGASIVFYVLGIEVSPPIRVGVPAEALIALGYDVTFATWFQSNDISRYDVFVFCRPHLNRDLYGGVFACAEAGKPVIIDLDDNFHRIPQTFPDYENFKHEIPFITQMLEKMLAVSTQVTTATPQLAEFYQRWAKNTTVIPNGWSQSNPAWSAASPVHKTINLGWAGTCTHYEDLKMVKKPLLEVLQENPETHLVIGGDKAIYSLFNTLPSERKTFIPNMNFIEYPNMLSSFDILLAPLVLNEFNHAKSDIKLLEAGIRKIPWIASPVMNYRDWGVGGLFATDEEDWYKQITRLLSNPNLRDNLGLEGHQKALEREKTQLVKHWVGVLSSLGFPPPDAVEAHPIGRIPVSSSIPIQDTRSPQQILSYILEAEDIPAAIEEIAPHLDSRTLDLINTNIATARSEGETELVEGLEALGSYINQYLAERMSPLLYTPKQSPEGGRPSAREVFTALLDAEDIEQEIIRLSSFFDRSLLHLVQENRSKALVEGEDDLAEGLSTLEQIIEQELSKTPDKGTG